MSSELIQDDRAPETPESEEPNQLTEVLEALGDATCRVVLRALRARGVPMTVQELSTAADVSLTSTYRKLDRLTEAGLVEELDELDADGHRRARYRPLVDQVEVELGSADGMEVSLYHTATELRIGGS